MFKTKNIYSTIGKKTIAINSYKKSNSIIRTRNLSWFKTIVFEIERNTKRYAIYNEWKTKHRIHMKHKREKKAIQNVFQMVGKKLKKQLLIWSNFDIIYCITIPIFLLQSVSIIFIGRTFCIHINMFSSFIILNIYVVYNSFF